MRSDGRCCQCCQRTTSGGDYYYWRFDFRYTAPLRWTATVARMRYGRWRWGLKAVVEDLKAGTVVRVVARECW
jgi:hypothetical protein